MLLEAARRSLLESLAAVPLSGGKGQGEASGGAGCSRGGSSTTAAALGCVPQLYAKGETPREGRLLDPTKSRGSLRHVAPALAPQQAAPSPSPRYAAYSQRRAELVHVPPPVAPPPSARPESLGALLDELGAETLRQIGPVSPCMKQAREARAREAQARSEASVIKRMASELQPVGPHRLPEPSHVALELAAEDLPNKGVQPRQVDPAAFRFAAHPTAEHGGVTARVGVLAPYFEQYSAYGGADPRSTPRGGGARGGARSGGRGARSAGPAMSLGSRFSSVWGSIASSIAASLDAAADALSPRLSPFSLSPRSSPSSSTASPPLDAATVLARARAAQGRHTPLGDTPLRV